MKIAVSGAHNTGKTTLVENLSGSLPSFTVFEEPYYQLSEEGYIFAEMPSREDFEAQLERSIANILESDGDCLFDRCPADILAYLIAQGESEELDVNLWLPAAREALQELDLIIFVPIEFPDRVTLSAAEFEGLRRRVDEELQDIVLDDRWTFGIPSIEVVGSLGERTRQVLASLGVEKDPRRA